MPRVRRTAVLDYDSLRLAVRAAYQRFIGADWRIQIPARLAFGGLVRWTVPRLYSCSAGHGRTVWSVGVSLFDFAVVAGELRFDDVIAVVTLVGEFVATHGPTVAIVVRRGRFARAGLKTPRRAAAKFVFPSGLRATSGCHDEQPRANGSRIGRAAAFSSGASGALA